MRRGLKYIVLMPALIIFLFSVSAAEPADILIKKSHKDETNIKWISLPYNEFKKASDAAGYINKEEKNVISIIKWIPEKGSAVRYSYKESMQSWVGIDFEIMPWEAVGIQQSKDEIVFVLPNGTGYTVDIKGSNEEKTYAVSIPYGKYGEIRDIIKSIEKNEKQPEKISRAAVWSVKDSVFKGMQYDEEKGGWTGNNEKIGKYDAVFITLKRGVESLNWTP